MAGTGYKLDTIFQVRNAGELQLIVDAMELADNNRDTPGNRPSEFTDVFSLRDDAFGFDGSPDGIAAFREFLRDRLSGDPASGGVSFVAINLAFSTVRDRCADLTATISSADRGSPTRKTGPPASCRRATTSTRSNRCRSRSPARTPPGGRRYPAA
ncbi:MAG: hypothetical protein R3F11_09640 [Verrucomicrobiales bacterium]